MRKSFPASFRISKVMIFLAYFLLNLVYYL